ncbi:MAG: hypothetical protein ACI9CZ_001670, partial [Flavobacterium sp.]
STTAWGFIFVSLDSFVFLPTLFLETVLDKEAVMI